MAHFLAIDFTVPKVVAVCKPGTVFQILAIRLVSRLLNPGTGGQMFSDSVNLVFLLFSFFAKRQDPNGFIDFFHFQTNTAIAEAAALFRH